MVTTSGIITLKQKYGENYNSFKIFREIRIQSFLILNKLLEHRFAQKPVDLKLIVMVTKEIAKPFWFLLIFSTE